MLAVALVLRAQRQRMIDAARAEQDVVSRARKRRDDAMLAERAPRDPQSAQEVAARRELDLLMAPVIAEGLATMDHERGRADAVQPLPSSVRSSAEMRGGGPTWGGTCTACGKSVNPYTGSWNC